jgi:hypothetical protein
MFGEALRSVGVDAQAWTRKPYFFPVPEQAELVLDLQKKKKELIAVETICYMHSRFQKFPVQINGKKLAVFHGGSNYRRNPSERNRLFNKLVFVTLIQTPDLMGLGAKNEVWMIPPVDTEYIRPVDYKSKEVIFAHFPRHPKSKRSNIILEAVKSIDSIRFDYKFEQIPWEENIKRMSNCDVYIESQAYGLGEWGVTALEAAALGKVVVTVFKSKERYEREWGPCPIIPANSKEELRLILKGLACLTKKDIRNHQEETRKWVVQNHSLEATGKRLKGVLQC